MPNKMLIDASHPEETRVVVVRGNRIEEFDFESQAKKQLKGNIYLARVTRVEPSLQAAFIEYGGNRHGFLAFSEIHPDYYQIPVADRQALLAAEAAADAEEDEAEAERAEGGRRKRKRGMRSRGRAVTREGGSPDGASGESGDDGASPAVAASADRDAISQEPESAGENSHREDDDRDPANGDNDHDEGVEMVGAEDALDELPDRRRALRRNYKIQEVIKRRQIMLVQVVKEERGNKGAALTTYLSLAGRYSVLMPNTGRGGGISRKITSAPDRKRLKEIVHELEVPQGMGVILRTAGANRTKAEIKRDYEYLMRLWMRIRTLTLESTAPTLVHEEGSLIKRSVRDLYNKDIDEIQVAGEEGYREAKDFMRMLMPSHAKVVQPYRDKVPIFARNGIEAQLDRMLQPQVTLKSGGYIIINQTEALVSIDVNSGRSTREHSIESTALQTNLEAAEEVARQLRLRDMAGLIVIDFIDMEEKRNNRSVEKRLKDCLKNDRARIQVGRISHFGLLEMSRQRIRASVLESTMQPCPTCNGTGHIRSESSVALHVIRGIEEYLLKETGYNIVVRTSTATALYVLNNKRSTLTDLENRFGLSIHVEADDTLGTQHFVVFKGEPSTRTPMEPPPVPVEEVEEVEEEEVAETSEAEAETVETARQGEDGGGRKKRRRRRRRGGQGRELETHADMRGEALATAEEVSVPAEDDGAEAEAEGEVEVQPKKRRRGRRGGKRSRPMTAEGDEGAAEGEGGPPVAEEAPIGVEEGAIEVEAPAAPEAAVPAEVAPEVPAEVNGAEVEAPPAKRVRRSAAARKPRSATAQSVEPPVSEPVVVSTASPDESGTAPEEKPRKEGWWRRKGFF